MTSLMLFLQFMKFGFLCFGGGYMIIPLLNEAYVTQTPFFTSDEFGNLLSLSQMTPGAVSINTATYVGFLKSGIFGAVFASIGLIMPSLLLAIPLLSLFRKYKETWIVQGFLKGVRIAAFVMVLYAVVLFFNMSVLSVPLSLTDITASIQAKTLILPQNFKINLLEGLICICAFIAVYFYKMNVTKALFISALFGLGVSFL